MPYDLKRLEGALSACKDPSRVTLELRHQKWFSDEVFGLLNKFNVVFCHVDTPPFQLKEPVVTGNAAYVRLHGKDKGCDYNYTKLDLINIAKFMDALSEKGAKTVYTFFNNDGHAYAPKNALELVKIKKFTI